MNLSDHLYAVEFVGGPLDGHKEVISNPTRLLQMIRVPITQALLAVVSRDPRNIDWKHDTVTSRAMYLLKQTSASWRYEHFGAASATSTS